MASAPTTGTVEKLVREAKVFAALSGKFDPKLALPPSGTDPDLLIDVASQLAAACDTDPDDGEGWLLRTSERKYIIETLRESGELHQAVERRRTLDPDPETADLLLALEEQGPFSSTAIAADLESSPSEERVQRIVVALDRAGNHPDLLQAARSELAAIGRETRRKLLQERGFFGRKEEMRDLEGWLAVAQEQVPVRAAYLSGLPGIGKSALLEEMVSRLGDTFAAVTVRLDFDRAGLDVLDILGLTMEVARQVGERLGDEGRALLDARLAAASQRPGEESLTSSRRSFFPRELGAAIGATIAKSGRPATLVLDTLEVLRARGVQHPASLFAWIDDLLGFGMKPLRIIAAGRGEALDSCADRIGMAIYLGGLDTPASTALLDRLEVPPGDRDPILEIAQGNPLVLRLGAEVVKRFGADELPQRQLDQEVSAAFLYRFLLSRIEEPTLARLAHPGLVTRRISAGLLRDVLAKVLELPLSEQDALVAFENLASQHWLVMRDPVDPEFVIHRSDMRMVLLPLFYKQEPELCARIDKAAIEWFGRRPDPASQRDAAYHRLQLMRRSRGARPPISSAVAVQFDDEMIAELPPQAQQVVLRARGGRSAIFQDSSSAAPVDDRQLAAELGALIDRQDWVEGQYVVDRALEAGGFDPRSQAADAVRAFHWRSGKWVEARRLLRERDDLGADDSDLADLPWPLAIARLEMRAEFTPGRLRAALSPPLYDRLHGEFSRGLPSPARCGALAFRLAGADEQLLGGAEAQYSKDADPVAAAFGQWGWRPNDAARRAFEIARDRLGARGISVAAQTDSTIGQMLAVHTPYAVFAANLSTQSGYSWLLEDAERDARALAEAGGLLVPPPAGAASSFAANPLADIGDLGLFAEWADATGFLRRDPNLRAVGRAAERWRRTVAGWWSYGRSPRSWRRPPVVDAVLAARVEAARREHGKPNRWEVQLWRGPDGTPVEFADLARRIDRSLRDASRSDGPEAAARRLLRWRVPAAFVPALVAALEARQSR